MKAYIRNALGALCATLFLVLAQTAAADARAFLPETARETGLSVTDDQAKTQRLRKRTGGHHTVFLVVRGKG